MSNRLAAGPAIRFIRDKVHGYSLNYVAIECLMSPAQLSNIEAGRRWPDDATLAKIADVLGVSVEVISVDLDCDRAVKQMTKRLVTA